MYLSFNNSTLTKFIHCEKAKLTISTNENVKQRNGYLIDDEFINAVKQYPGKLKFNVSLHSTDPETYISIVNPTSSPTHNSTKLSFLSFSV